MTDFSLHRAAGAPARRASVLSKLMAALDVWRSRQHLKGLDPSQLDDIGIAQIDAIKEANRPIWDVPAHWMQ